MSNRTPGERLKQLIESKGYTLGEVAKDSGVNRSGLYQYCNGKKDLTQMSFLNVCKIAKAVDITLDELAANVLDEA